MRRALGLLIALSAAALIGCGDSQQATAKVPRSFFGIAPQDATTDADLARMASGGVASYHVILSWARVEQTEGSYDWSSYDELFGELAANGMEPIPYVFGTPEYLAADQNAPPTDSKPALRAWDRFLKAAAERYGPNGEFWDLFALTHPGVEPRPVTVWEIWNEVNGPAFWAPRPSPSAYAKLLKRSERDLHKVDRDAQIMVAGMFATPSSHKAIKSFKFLRQMYRKRGVKQAVDLVAIHPYGPEIKDVKRQMTKTYKQMRKAGDGGAGMWVTEIGWGTDTGVKSQLTVPPKKQAKLLRKAYKLMIRKRRRWNVQGVLWYTWRDPANPVGLCGWCASAGLVDNDLDPKPAWRAYTKLTGGKP